MFWLINVPPQVLGSQSRNLPVVKLSQSNPLHLTKNGVSNITREVY